MARPALAMFTLLAAGALVVGAAAPAARADTPTCATTADGSTPTAAPGRPCWVDVQSYPFGWNGQAVVGDASSCPVPGILSSCYLRVTSLAFRAWNFGLAAVVPAGGSTAPNPFPVWLFNGVRWTPEPTPPTVCQGTTVLWAGKLDFWLLDSTSTTWPSLCRFDGENFIWEPLAVPKAALAHVTGVLGTVGHGACFAWDNCWFFGTAGVVVHWDGQSLSDATPGLGPGPLLEGDYVAAVARTDLAGNQFGFASTRSVPGQPSQLIGSSGGPFSPLTFSPPASPGIGSVSLASFDFNSQGQGWVIGSNPAYSPLFPISTNGAGQPCPALPLDSFPAAPGSGQGFSWNAISAPADPDAVYGPDGGAVVGGQQTDIPVAGGQFTYEPVLGVVSCDGPPSLTRFTVPDPIGGGAILDAKADVVAVAANAVNDAWAATGESSQTYGDQNLTVPPHLYHLTDGQPPDAPAGDANERRLPVFQPEPQIFELQPPVVIPPAPPPTVVPKRGPARHRTKHVPAAVYDVHRPTVTKLTNGKFLLRLSFRVRRKVRIGLKGLRGGRVVSASRVQTFTGRTGTLTLTLDRNAWPTKLKFVLPKQAAHA